MCGRQHVLRVGYVCGRMRVCCVLLVCVCELCVGLCVHDGVCCVWVMSLCVHACTCVLCACVFVCVSYVWLCDNMCCVCVMSVCRCVCVWLCDRVLRMGHVCVLCAVLVCM